MGFYCYNMGRRHERTASAVQLTDRDATSRRAYVASLEATHAKFMHEITMTTASYNNKQNDQSVVNNPLVAQAQAYAHAPNAGV